MYQPAEKRTFQSSLLKSFSTSSQKTLAPVGCARQWINSGTATDATCELSACNNCHKLHPNNTQQIQHPSIHSSVIMLCPLHTVRLLLKTVLWFSCVQFCFNNVTLFSALTLLVGRQEGYPACKNRVVGCWHGYLSAARCRFAHGQANAIATHCLLLQ